MQSEQFLMLPVPLEAAEAAGITPMSVLQCQIDEDGRLIIEIAHPDPESFDCNGDCDSCPFYQAETDRCEVFDDFIDTERVSENE